jgi:hypothetical protein
VIDDVIKGGSEIRPRNALHARHLRHEGLCEHSDYVRIDIKMIKLVGKLAQVGEIVDGAQDHSGEKFGRLLPRLRNGEAAPFCRPTEDHEEAIEENARNDDSQIFLRLETHRGTRTAPRARADVRLGSQPQDSGGAASSAPGAALRMAIGKSPAIGDRGLPIFGRFHA